MAKNKSKTKSSALVIPTSAPHAKSASQPATTNGSSSSGSNNNGAEPLLMRLCKHCCEDYSQAVDPNRIKKTFASFKSSSSGDDASCHHAPKCSTCKQLQSTVEDDDLFLNCFNGLFYCPKHAFQKKNTQHGGGIIINISTLKSICLSCPSSTDIGFTRTKSVFHLKQPNDEHINRFVNVLKYVKSQVETCFGSESIYTKSLKMELETAPPRDYQMIQALQILSQTIAAKSAASQSDTDAKWNIQNNQYLSTMRGLYNLGNTCFFNSTMQALTHTHTLASFYLNLSAVYPTLNIPKKITFTDAKSLSFALTLFYNSIYKLPQQQKGELFVPYNPSKLFEAICDKFPLFRGYGQHDATELLRFVCSHVRDEYIDDFKKKNAATTTNSNDSQNETTETSSASTTVTSIQPPPTVIDDCFKIILNSSVFCSHCGHVSTIKEMAHDLSIPIPKTKENLYLHFKELFEREKKTFEQHAMANGSDDSSSTAATSTTNSMMLNPEEVLSTIPQQMNGVHLAHCLWGFVTHDLLEGDDGYRCEKCSHLIDENNEEKTSSNASTNSSDVATSSETSNHTGTTSPTTADNNSSASNKPKYTLRNACKQFSIAQLPQVLTIHLKRFVSMHQMLRKKKRSILDDYLMSTGAHSFMKDNAQIIFPTSIDMAPYIHPSHRQDEENKQTVYDLYAIVEHSGTMHGGHYVAYVKQLIIDGGQQFKRGDWFYISDSHVKKVVSEKQVLEEARPYLLFYEKRRK
ncbi:hypothetical protein C9374_009154 [Naegleria lovaniensis]|uniref:Ubiquitin carboxyl-terminal hydrolase n=1 Tax=Naegleria lovaniensis TaxID=51637 RepID=A0AA88KHB0_NAELO|nr:uncharacterized protein C9374_009154 [Naegleria lovaniensis]KAG2377638.1 hypothetical protein C9374_009154 [Naegleria lovaniensis]